MENGVRAELCACGRRSLPVLPELSMLAGPCSLLVCRACGCVRVCALAIV